MKKIRSAAPLCAAMLFALTLGGPVIAASGDSPASDSWITAKTKLSLSADERVKGRQVSVETKDGEVILRGTVDTAQAKAAAEDIANGIDNVKGVKNELQVVAPRHQEVVAASDDVITKRVKKCFSRKSDLRKANIGVTTNDGVVSLTGEVPDFWTSAKASWDAWKESGVKSVKNDLTIKEKPQPS
jgi:hyperosmotically inducible protein